MINSPDGAALSAVLTVLSSERPSKDLQGAATPSAAVLVLHGGGTDSLAATRWTNLAVLRLWPFARTIARREPGSAVYRLKFAVRGWNGDGSAALRDVRWALAAISQRHPGVPIVLVGHSMGGRVALRAGGDDAVVGVVLLEPWAPSDEPAAQLAGRDVVVIRGGRDRVIPPATTNPWLASAAHHCASLSQTLLPWAGHAMLRRFWVWHRLAADGVHDILAARTATSSVVPQPQSGSSATAETVARTISSDVW